MSFSVSLLKDVVDSRSTWGDVWEDVEEERLNNYREFECVQSIIRGGSLFMVGHLYRAT